MVGQNILSEVNIGMYMHLRNYLRLKELNSEALATESDALLLKYSQVRAF